MDTYGLGNYVNWYFDGVQLKPIKIDIHQRVIKIVNE